MRTPDSECDTSAADTMEGVVKVFTEKTLPNPVSMEYPPAGRSIQERRHHEGAAHPLLVSDKAATWGDAVP